jgi:hypothetical protein
VTKREPGAQSYRITTVTLSFTPATLTDKKREV